MRKKESFIGTKKRRGKRNRKIDRASASQFERLRFCYRTSKCTEMRFASFLSSGFITAIVVKPPERKLAKRTSVQCPRMDLNKKS
jgi:hypothetical protein